MLLKRSTVVHSFFWICGRFWFSNNGFISASSFLEGVPSTLMISTIWSMLDSPWKSGCPEIISAITQPDWIECEWPRSSRKMEVTHGPNIDGRSVLRRPKNQLRGSVVPGANVSDVGVWSSELLGWSEVTQNCPLVVEVDEDILGLDVSVADPLTVNVSQRFQDLVGVELDQNVRSCLSGSPVIPDDFVESVRDELHHNV